MDDPATGGAMSIVVALIVFVVVGLGLGALARLLLPGRDDMSLLKTLDYGMGGSLLGGFVARALRVTNSIAAIAVAIAMALIWFFTRRGQSARTTM